MRNHGNSDHHDSMTYKEMADDVIRYADNKNIDRFTIIGHSMGGKTAMTLATLHPERIDGIIIVDAPPKNTGKEEGFRTPTDDLVHDHINYRCKDLLIIEI